MDKATEDELYQLGAYARLNGLDLALRWLMREVAIANRRPRPRKKIRVRLPGGGQFWMERGRLRED
jgi:hypothetical protein